MFEMFGENIASEVSGVPDDESGAVLVPGEDRV